MATTGAQTLNTFFKSDVKGMLDGIAKVKAGVSDLKDSFAGISNKLTSESAKIRTGVLDIRKSFSGLSKSSATVADNIFKVEKTLSGSAKALNDYVKSIRSIGMESNAYKNAVKLIINSTKGVGHSFAQAAAAVRTTDKALSESRKAYSEHLKSFHNIIKGSKEWRQEMGRFSTGAQLGRASLAKLKGEIDGSAQSLIAWIAKQKNASQNLKSFSQNLSAVGASAQKATSQVSGATARTAKSMTAYEKALKSVTKQGAQYAKTFELLVKNTRKSSTANLAAVQSLRKTDENLAKLKRGYADYLVKIKGISRHSKKFADEMFNVSQKTNLTKSSLATYTGVIKNNVKSLAEWIAESKKLSSGNLKDYAAALDKVGKSAKNNAPKVNKFSSALGQTVSKLKNLSQYAIVASAIYKIASAFREGIDEVVKFDQALRNLQAISGEPFYRIQVMAETLKTVARETKFSTAEAAEGMVLLTQSGFSASEALNTIRAAANLAAGTLSDFRNTADILTTSIRAFEIATISAGMVADVWANAVNKSKLSIDKIKIAMNYIGVAASQAGVSIKESASAMMLMANRGARASTIGTGFRQVLSKMLNPSAKLRDALHGVGKTLDDINPNIDKAGNNLTGFQESMQTVSSLLYDTKTGTIDMGKAFEFFQLRGAQAAAVLSKAFAEGSEFEQAMGQVGQVGTAMAMAATQSEGLGFKLKNLSDRAKTLMVSIGETGLTDAFRVFVTILSHTVQVIEKIVTSGFASVIVQVTTLTTLIYLLNRAAQTTTFLAMIKSVSGFGIAMVAAQAKVIAFNTSLKSMAVSQQFSALGAVIMGPLKAAFVSLGKVILAHPILALSAVLIVVAKATYFLYGRNMRLAESYARLSVENRKAYETLAGYKNMLKEAGQGTEEYENIVKRFALEQKELAKEIKLAVGSAELKDVDKNTLFVAIENLEKKKLKITINNISDSVKKMALIYRNASIDANNATQGFVRGADRANSSQTDLTDTTKKYSGLVLDLAKNIKDMHEEELKGSKGKENYKEKIEAARKSSLEYVKTLGLVGDTGGKTEKAINVMFDNMVASANKKLPVLESVIKKMPDSFQKAFNKLGSIEKGNFIELQGQLASRIDEYKRHARDLLFTEEEKEQGVAAIRAKGYAQFITDNEGMIGETENREEKIAEIIEGFMQQTIDSAEATAEGRKKADAAVAGYSEILNKKYVGGIKKSYKEVSDIIKTQLSELEGKFSALQNKLKGVTASISTEQKQYQQSIKDIQRLAMTDEQKWLDERKEANRLLAEGIKDKNVESLKESQSMFKSLAREVKGSNNKMVKGLDETSKAASAGMQTAHNAIMGILAKQKGTLEKDVATVGEKIEDAKALLDSYRAKVQEVSKEKLSVDTSELKEGFNTALADLAHFKNMLQNEDIALNFKITASSSPKRPLSEKLPAVKKQIDNFVKDASSEASINIKITGEGGAGEKPLGDELPRIQKELDEFVNETDTEKKIAVEFDDTKTQSTAKDIKKFFEGMVDDATLTLEEIAAKSQAFFEMFNNTLVIDIDATEANNTIDRLAQRLRDLNAKIAASASAAASAAASATPGFASGGSVFGPGGIDKVLARLTKDEFVQPVASVRAYGQDVMEGFRHRMFPVENVRALLAAGRQKLSNVSARASQLDLSGMRPKTTITQPQMTMPTIIHPSTVKGYAGGGSVSDMGMPRIKNMGSLEFAAAGPGPQIFGSVSALEMLKAQILNEKKRSFNG